MKEAEEGTSLLRCLCEAEKDGMIAREEQRVHGGFGVLLVRFRKHHIYKLRENSSIERDNEDKSERQDGLTVMVNK